MGRATDGKVSGIAPYDGDPRTAAIRHDIERTRDEMEDTVNAIETRLSPARIKEQISSVKEHALDQFKDAKDQVKHELVHDLEEAKFKVKNEIGEARAAVREATVGKVEHMVQRASTQVRGAGTSVVDTIRENPIPAALVGAGLSWLIVSGFRSRKSSRSFDYSYGRNDYRRGDMGVYGGYEGEFGGRRRSYDMRGEDFGDEHFGEGDYGHEGDLRGRVHDVAEGARDMAHKAGDKVSEVADTVRERAGEVVETARHRVDDARDYAGRFYDDARERASHYYDEGRVRMYRAREGAERMFDENPLALGAIAIAVGAAVGLAIPSTEVEDRVFGEYKDRLLEGANEMAHDAIKSVEEKATQALHGGEQGDQKNAQGENKQQQGLGIQSSERRI